MYFNTDLKIKKEIFKPSDLYYKEFDGFLDEIVDDSTIDDIEESYSRLPAMVTLEQITEMYNKELKLTISGELTIEKILASPYHLTIFYESENMNDFILDLDTRKDDYSLSLF